MNKLQQQISKDFAAVRYEQASGLCGGGLCEAIRTAVALNEEATVRDVIAALPDCNPTTVRIQFAKSHKLIAEDDNLLAALKIANNTQAKVTKKADDQLTPSSLALFLDYANDAGNWGGTPLVGGNVGGDLKAERGNLTDMKKKGYITTASEDGDTWVCFTAKGKALAAEHGITI